MDALSRDGRFGLTIIAFVGSVFSPYYAWAGRANPKDHVAINVALYGPRGRWAMTERGEGALQQSEDCFQVGPSRLSWDGEGLTIEIDERSSLLSRPVRGVVRVRPWALNAARLVLDGRGRHRWGPIAPGADVEAEFRDPNLSWRGAGYFDANDGDESLEEGFREWHWSRAHLGRDTAVLYEVQRRDGTAESHALLFGRDGKLEQRPSPPKAPLPGTGWRIRRLTRADDPTGVRLVKTFEDTPFYARSALETRLFGQGALAVHESLDLDRFSAPWVRRLLPFRMPRAG